MDKTIQFERVRKIALENVGLIRRHVCTSDSAAFAVVKHYLETGEALRTRRIDCPDVMAKFTETLEKFIRELDVRCVGELLELIPKGMDSRLPEWLYGPVEASLGESGWEISPAVLI